MENEKLKIQVTVILCLYRENNIQNIARHFSRKSYLSSDKKKFEDRYDFLEKIMEYNI